MDLKKKKSWDIGNNSLILCINVSISLKKKISGGESTFFLIFVFNGCNRFNHINFLKNNSTLCLNNSNFAKN